MAESKETTESFEIAALIPNTVAAVGALDFDVRAKGISPRRLPSWTRPQVPVLMDTIVRMPSGVRLRFASDATRLGLTFHGTNMVTPPAVRSALTLNLETQGGLLRADSAAGNCLVLDPKRNGEFKLERGEPDTLWFEGLPGVMTQFDLWLPHNAFVELQLLHISRGAQLQPAQPSAKPKWMHYGSSISHCMEAKEPAKIWPAVAARLAGADLYSLGFGGQCHLDQFVARTIRDSDAQIISAKIGINVINMDSMRERVFVSALHGFLDTVREGKPDTPLMLISPIYCPSAETHPGPTIPNEAGKFVTVEGSNRLRQGCLTLTRVRQILSEVVTQRQAQGDAALTYFDGLGLFGAADAHDLPDDLHPNPAGYIRMGERFAPQLTKLVESLQ